MAIPTPPVPAFDSGKLIYDDVNQWYVYENMTFTFTPPERSESESALEPLQNAIAATEAAYPGMDPPSQYLAKNVLFSQLFFLYKQYIYCASCVHLSIPNYADPNELFIQCEVLQTELG